MINLSWCHRQIICNYFLQRHLNVLTRVLGTVRKPRNFWGHMRTNCPKTQICLGQIFFTCLAKKTKSHKDGANIMQELGVKSRFKPSQKKQTFRKVTNVEPTLRSIECLCTKGTNQASTCLTKASITPSTSLSPSRATKTLYCSVTHQSFLDHNPVSQVVPPPLHLSLVRLSSVNPIVLTIELDDMIFYFQFGVHYIILT